MQTAIIEFTDGQHYGKFLLGRFDEEWSRNSDVYGVATSLLRVEGWTERHLLVLDLSSTGVAGIFAPVKGGSPGYDTIKKGIHNIV